MNRLADYELGSKLGVKAGMMLATIIFTVIWSIGALHWYWFALMLLYTAFDAVWTVYKNMGAVREIRQGLPSESKDKRKRGHEYE